MAQWKSLCFVVVIIVLMHSTYARFGSKFWLGMKPTCGTKSVLISVKKNDCHSNQPVEINYCEGTCPSASVYKRTYPYYRIHCYCCKASVMKVLEVKLICPDGREEIALQDNAVKCKCQVCTQHK